MSKIQHFTLVLPSLSWFITTLPMSGSVSKRRQVELGFTCLASRASLLWRPKKSPLLSPVGGWCPLHDKPFEKSRTRWKCVTGSCCVWQSIVWQFFWAWNVLSISGSGVRVSSSRWHNTRDAGDWRWGRRASWIGSHLSRYMWRGSCDPPGMPARAQSLLG